MDTPTIYLSPPHLGEEEFKLLAEAFRANQIASVGPHIQEFEKNVADYLGVPGTMAVSSGTAAIHLGLRLLGVGKGDTVFCSSFTFVASAHPILYLGASPVFIDSEEDSWNMAPQALERALAEADRAGKIPKAVVVVNLYGQSADMDRLLALCNRYEVPVLEDAAESLGATYRGNPSGSFGAIAALSFNGNKIVTSSGGGMLVARDPRHLEKARIWANQARDPEVTSEYSHRDMGYNYRLSNLCAAIGCGQMHVLADRIAARRAVFERYQLAFRSIDGFYFMPEARFGSSTRWLTVLTVDPDRCGFTAEQLIEVLARENIETSRVWKPLHSQPLFEGTAYYPCDSAQSVSDKIFAGGLCLPSGSNLKAQDQERIIDRVFRHLRRQFHIIP